MHSRRPTDGRSGGFGWGVCQSEMAGARQRKGDLEGGGYDLVRLGVPLVSVDKREFANGPKWKRPGASAAAQRQAET